MLQAALQQHRPELATAAPVHRDFRAGDVRHSRADIGKAARLLGYVPSHDIRAGLQVAARWYAGA
jgi:UDP-N-acetylglucosamine 4-epimerase